MRAADAVLRPATVADVAVIAPFHLDCWREAYPGIVPQAFLDQLVIQDRTQRWQQRLARPGDLTILAWRGDALAGLATVGPQHEPAPLPGLELRSLYVGAAHQGLGLGRRLVDAALGDRPATLWVFEANARARGFYRATGWRPTGERRLDPGTQVWELRLVRNGDPSNPGST